MELIKEFLDEKYDKYNTHEFIANDPISIPHQFTRKEDIEIAGFLSASIAWGKRNIIVRNAQKIVENMGNSPYDFVCNAKDEQIERFLSFKHRTFNGIDAVFFVKSLQAIYTQKGGLQTVFEEGLELTGKIQHAIDHFRSVFLQTPHLERSEKHLSDVRKKSEAKRINMFLRWMVRNDKRGVDFGLWNIPSSKLMMPLDVHTGNCGRKLELLTRKQNDWLAVEELTHSLSIFDPNDPVKYDFALFGLGIDEKFCTT